MDDVICADPGCGATRKRHYWGAVKAHGAGWFDARDGSSYCPDHIPAWVAGWRARRHR